MGDTAPGQGDNARASRSHRDRSFALGTRRLVSLSAIPLALVGAGALWVAAVSPSIVWMAVGLAAIVSAVGVSRGMRWALLGETILGAIVVLGVAFVAVFSLALTAATDGSLDGPMFGTPLGVLNGWASLALYAIALGAGLWMLAAGVSGLRPSRIHL